MIYIRRHQAPRVFTAWIAQQLRNAPQNLVYASLPQNVATAVRTNRLLQQRNLCPYTQIALPSAADCHIEHMVPQAATTRRPGQANLDLQYRNMIACFPVTPGPGGGEPGYGAREKGGTAVTAANFVFPNVPNCETRFVFASDGTISAPSADKAAVATIALLKLDHAHLNELRDQAIQNAGLRRTAAQPVSAKQALRLADETLSATRLPEFAVVLRMVARAYAEREVRHSTRMAGRPTR